MKSVTAQLNLFLITSWGYFKAFRYNKYFKVISKSFGVNFGYKIENLSILRFCSVGGSRFLSKYVFEQKYHWAICISPIDMKRAFALWKQIYVFV